MLQSVCMMQWCQILDPGCLASLSAEESGRDIEILGLLRCSLWFLLGLTRCVGLETFQQAFSTASRLLEGGRIHRITVHGLGIILPPGSCFGKHLVERDGREDDTIHESFGSLDLKPWAVPCTYSPPDKGGMHRMLVMDLRNGIIRNCGLQDAKKVQCTVGKMGRNGDCRPVRPASFEEGTLSPVDSFRIGQEHQDPECSRTVTTVMSYYAISLDLIIGPSGTWLPVRYVRLT